MKKFLSIILSVTMMFSMFATAFAAENTTGNIENGIEYITVYDDVNNTVQAVQRNVDTGELVYGPVITVDTANNSAQSSFEVTAFGADVHQDTFLNFEYDIWYGTQDEWNLERPSDIFSQNYFMVYENASNRDLLNDWKDDVDALNAQEWAVIGGIGLSIFNIVKAAMVSHAAIASGGVLTAAAVDAIKDAAVAAGGTAIGIGFLCTTYNNCVRSYKAVLNNTDNIHY